MASGKRMIQSGIRLSKLGGINAGSTMNGLGAVANSYRSLCSNSSGNRLDYGQISPTGKRVCLVDNLAMVRSLEGQGISSKHAEAITSAMTQVWNESLKTTSQYLISNDEKQKILMALEANFSKFKSEVQRSQEQGHLLKSEVEKLQNNIEKMRYEIAKVPAGQHSDLNLERWRELADRTFETTNRTIELKREIRALRIGLEAAKYGAIKYCMRTLCASAAGIGLISFSKSRCDQVLYEDPICICCWLWIDLYYYLL